MGDIRGFLKHTRELPKRRPVDERLGDWREVYQRFPTHRLRDQASRCMDCGVPFCNLGCPLGNIIPDWNDLVYRDQWREAMDRLHATNNFPEFTAACARRRASRRASWASTSRRSPSSRSR